MKKLIVGKTYKVKLVRDSCGHGGIPSNEGYDLINPFKIIIKMPHPENNISFHGWKDDDSSRCWAWRIDDFIWLDERTKRIIKWL